MADWAHAWSAAVRAGRAVVARRAPAALAAYGRAAGAHRRAVRSLVAAFADGAIDERTLDTALADESGALERELRALPAIGPRGARDAARAAFGSLNAALIAGVEIAV